MLRDFLMTRYGTDLMMSGQLDVEHVSETPIAMAVVPYDAIRITLERADGSVTLEMMQRSRVFAKANLPYLISPGQSATVDEIAGTVAVRFA